MNPVRFSEEALAGWKSILLAEAAGLRKAIDLDRQQLDGRADSLPPAFDDGRDDAAIDALRDIDVAELERRSTQLAEVEAALQRVEDGTFGVCLSCGEAIDSQRLHAAPQSARCIGCQSAAEPGRAEFSSL
ncbi:MAG: TraR/DksA C4-type zinc finger protein [Betaproteobacteria bacterium]|nr:TraR/DksA C4-type zinc finger protein [Betaproteobacteria bacterium]